MSDATVLAGKRVLITGGAGGVGRAVVARMLEAGALVLLTDRPDADLSGIAAPAGATGTLYRHAADLGHSDEVAALFDAVDRQLGGLDILVACAGVGSGPLMEMDDAGWRNVLDSNLASYVACTKGAVDRIRAGGSDEGMIILVGSISVHIKAVGESVYNAAKGGVASFAETLRKELMPERIRLTLIEPGAIGSTMQPYTAAERQRFVEQYEMLPPDEVADAILYAATRPKGVDVVTLRIEPLHQKIC
ncbi:NADP-dependent 3-hydroxy acid dehydrogenase YdfG [Sphingomonas zeicaulis]|uniref:SDR family oxidoreductase n=1 Tax=Sphingomonas zeicaulis TaxID=1632740 RepID=UPI003D1EE2C5